MNQQHEDNQDRQSDAVLGQFAQILDKYDQKVFQLRSSAQRNYSSDPRRRKDPTAYNSMRADALEAERIKNDLSRLRQEIDQAEAEDEQSNYQRMQFSQPTDFSAQNALPDHPGTTLSPQIISQQVAIDRNLQTFQKQQVGAPTPNFTSMRGPMNTTQGGTISADNYVINSNDADMEPTQLTNINEPSVMESEHMQNNDISMVQDQDL